MRRFVRFALAAVLIASVAAGAGCKRDAEPGPALEPTIEPPAIGEAGVLRVGIDSSYPPFAGVDKDQTVGLDVDVAAAVSEILGLKLELVEYGEEGYAAALENGEVDIALGAIPLTEAVLTEVSFAGTYMLNGPSWFSGSETTATIESLAGKKIGAQEGSESFWTVVALYGDDVVTSYPTLREAIEAAEAGELDLVACDAAVGAYIARDHPSVRFVEQLAPATPLGVAVAKDATDLEAAIRDALDRLASDGVLDTIRTKWLGNLPQLEGAPVEE